VLCAIGIRGGAELQKLPFEYEYLWIMIIAVVSAKLITWIGFYLFRQMTTKENATALAASYGSISAITFITGAALLDKLGVSYGPYMIAVMALMESPAVLVALYLYTQKSKSKKSWMEGVHHALSNSSMVLLLGSFVIGMLLSSEAWGKVIPFYDEIFYGMLTLFLLDLGLLSMEQLEEVFKSGKRLFAMAIFFPLICALFAFGLGNFFAWSRGDTFLLMLLLGSASYIAVPAAMRTAVPKANPSVYLSMSMGITFPLSLIVGIPLYLWMTQNM
jgi:hypothetical protein